MSHRIGECSACGAVFKLPESFAHDQARCTKCGGVVNIGAAGAPAEQAPPVPAKKVVPRTPAPAAAPKERAGPSMKEKILARKRAEEEGGAKPAARPAAKPAAKAAAKPVAKSTSKAAARPAAKAAPARSGSRAGARGSSRSARGGDGEDKPARAARAGARSGASRRSARGGGGGDEEPNYRDRVAAQRKKSAILPGIIAVVLVGALGGFAWKWMQDQEEANAADNTEGVADGGAQDPEGTGGDALDAPTDDEGAGLGGTEEGGTDADPTLMDSEPGEEGGTDADPEGGADADPAPAKPDKPARDPASVDLAAIADFGKLPETSLERWAEIQQLAADGFDMEAGASAGRARTNLVEAGKEGFPAILNVFKSIDVGSDDGHRRADVVQKTLQLICNGNNFGWKYPGEEGREYFNKRVIESWCKEWDRCKDDDARWLKLTKQTGAAAEKPAEDESGLSGSDFDFDG